MPKSIQASAPGRCGILGNPSDIYGGAVLSCSIQARATCRLTEAEADALPADPTLWTAATARFPLSNVRVEWSSDVPRSSGLAGSTALLAATVAAVRSLRGDPVDLEDHAKGIAFAEVVRDIERFEAGVMCGFQDAYMVVNGGLSLMRFPGKRPDQRKGPAGKIESLEAPLPFLLITTGVQRLSGSVHGPIADRWLAGEPAVIDAMKWLAEAAPTGADALVNGNYSKLGELMNRNQRLVADLGGSGDPVDKLIQACLKHGALAAKLAGAGMGGTVIALTEDPDRLSNALHGVGYSQTMRPSIQPGLRFE